MVSLAKLAAGIAGALCSLVFLIWLFLIAPNFLCEYIEKGEMTKFKLALIGSGNINKGLKDKKYLGKTLIDVAIMNGKIKFVEYLLDKKADATKTVGGYTALHIAVIYNQKDIVELLLKKGSKIDATREGNITPLHDALIKGHENISQYLIDNGANVSAKTEFDQTCLHLSATSGNLELTKTFIERKLSPNAKDFKKWSPLFYACSKGHLEVARLLIEKGADYNYKFEDARKLPVDACGLARKGGNPSLLKYLRSIGAGN